MSTDVQPTLPVGPERPGWSRGRIADAIAWWTTRLGTLVLAAVWVAIWGSLSIASAGNEGLLKGVVLATYTVVPVFVYLGWRAYRAVVDR